MRKFILLLLIFLLGGCHDHHADKKLSSSVVIAHSKIPVQKLFYSGTLAPIKTIPVFAPVTGNITEIHFAYGARLKKGSPLFVLNSNALAEKYHKAVNDFLQKKQAYTTGKTTFAGTKVLYHAGIIAKNTYDTDKTQLENKTLDYLQAQYTLKQVLHTAHVDPKTIESLSMSDTTQVNHILQRRFQHIPVVATGSGIALFPLPQKSSNGNTTSGKLHVGDAIKSGQLLLSIGDLSGLRAKFQVSEVDIDRIHKNIKVTVKGNAFPGATLYGVITSVSAQANINDSSNVGMYDVQVSIPKVSPTIMKSIRVGMTAKFEIDIQASSRVMLPISAVFRQNGKSVVTILDKNNHQKTVPVITGETTLTDVVIIRGVKSGDRVVVK